MKSGYAEIPAFQHLKTENRSNICIFLDIRCPRNELSLALNVTKAKLFITTWVTINMTTKSTNAERSDELDLVCLSLDCSLSLALSLYVSVSLSLSLSKCLSLFIDLSVSHSLSLTFALPLALSVFCSLSLALTPSLTCVSCLLCASLSVSDSV